MLPFHCHFMGEVTILKKYAYEPAWVSDLDERVGLLTGHSLPILIVS